MSTEISKLLDNIERLPTNPNAIRRAILNTITSVSKGEVEIVDPTNPFVLLLEAGCVTAASLVRQNFVNLRKSYPNLATSMEDLYNHMSDADYLGRFATPVTSTVFKLYLPTEELIAVAPYIPGTEARQVTIPRYTAFKVNDTEFTTQYPIDIKIMPHGGFRVTYNTDIKSPMELLSSNTLDWSLGTIENRKFLQLNVPAWQFKRTVFTDSLNPASGFKMSYLLQDQFYHCRVFGISGNGLKTEFKTTHAEEIYDPLKPTALLRVDGQSLTVEIPVVYFSTGVLPSKIQIEIYTTKGQMSVNLGDYQVNAYSLKWGDDYNSPQQETYASPLNNLSTLIIYSESTAEGGTNGLTFEEMRERVISNGNKVVLPITDAQIRAGLQLRGFDVILAVDDLTKRMFLATKHLPAMGFDNLTSGVGVAVEMLQTDMSTLATLTSVKDNGLRMTVTPKTLFVYDDGKLQVVGNGQRPDQLANGSEQLVSLVNQKKYAFTPFHYVLDTSLSKFDLRAYYLDDPQIEGRLFIAENETTGLNVSTRNAAIEKTETGYRLLIVSKVSEVYKLLNPTDCFLQLRFKPAVEQDYAYINGELLGDVDGDWVWQFNIDSNLDIDNYNRIFLTNFAMYVENPRAFGAELTTMFELVYGVKNYAIPGLTSSQVDSAIGRNIQPGNVVGITHEALTVQLGVALTNLSTNSRTVAGNIEYERHPQDVPLTYSKTVYLRDGTGSIVLTRNPTTNDIEYTVLHRAGDPVLDEEGEQVYKYRAGDVIRDPVTNEPIEKRGRNTLRQIELLVLEGPYYFTTGSVELKTLEAVPKLIIDYLENDLEALRPSLLEGTEMFFTPKRTIGTSRVITEAGVETTIDASLSFKVRFFLTNGNYVNYALRDRLTETASRVINQVLKQNTVSIANIIALLKAEVGDDAVIIEVQRANGDPQLSYTCIDNATRASVRRLLQVLPNGELTVTEDIQVDFVRHIA